MAFSGALTLTDLNDFITPSQACIKPVEQVKPKQTKEPGVASSEIRIDLNGSYYEVSHESDTGTIGTEEKAKGQKLEQAQISLNDCLACSGCITSAESILITLQSHTEVLNFLESNKIASSSSQKIPVISIAPQTLASFAASLSSSSSSVVTPRQILRRLRVFCKDVLGFSYVFDTTFARHVALKEHVKEYIERKENHCLRRSDSVRGDGCTESQYHLPMLASACPGWICYAEKTHSEMLPFIAKTKSPQQVMGTLVKTWMGEKWGKRPDEIYHVSVMPCYDKKLEASRSDFYNEMYSTRDIDCVITTGELELLIQDKCWNLSAPVPEEMNAALPIPCKDETRINNGVLPELIQHAGSSSGSYLHTIIQHLELTSPTPLSLSVKQVRNADYEEYILTRQSDANNKDAEIVFKGAKCYGFRNLQNVVRKVGKESGIRVGVGAAGRLTGSREGRTIRRGKRSEEQMKEYDYIEVMACPGGCVNGGGQLKPPANWVSEGAAVEDGTGMTAAKWGNREWTKQVDETYWHDLPTPPTWPSLSDSTNGDGMTKSGEKEVAGKKAEMADRLLIDIENDLCWGLDKTSRDDRLRELFRTQYKAVSSEVIGLAVKW